MKLWHLDVKNYDNARWTWDCSYGYVVRAGSAAAARKLAASRAGDEKDEGYNPWLDPKQTTCKELKSSGKEEIIIQDFLSG